DDPRSFRRWFREQGENGIGGPLPGMLAGGACSGGARLLVGGGLAEGDDGIGERLGVAGRSSARPSLALATHREHISGSARGREARPEAIEQPGTVGEVRLQRRLGRGAGGG